MNAPENPYPLLAAPIEVGSMSCRNRILQTAHSKLFMERGAESRRNRDYQRERARGGAGLLITGNHLVHPTSPSRSFASSHATDAVAANRRVVDAVHEEGARIICQLNHLGANEVPAMDTLTPFWAPSSIRSHTTGDIAKAMEKSDIEELLAWWGQAAELSREAGFDGVEVHMGHGWLVHEFLSPIWNHRTDEYGGPFENRVRLAAELIAELRRRVGEDFVVGARISLWDGVAGGLEVEDAIAVARTLSGDGGIDYATMTAGGVQAPPLYGSPSDLPNGHLLEATARLKAETDLIVLTVGGMNRPAEAELVLADGIADMVAMTREQIADPEFVAKVTSGREDEVYHCIRANQGCIGRVNRGLPIGCTVNPAAGKEAVFGVGTQRPAESPGRWLVVGAGPAGLKAAVGLAERGHSVVLREAAEEVGGQVRLITRTPGRERLGLLVSDLVDHLGRLGVPIETGAEVSAATVADLDPDGVVIATGARPARSGFTIARPLRESIPGVDSENVISAWEAIEGVDGIGEDVLLLEDDGGRYAAGVAEVLLDGGHRVHLVTPLDTLFPNTRFTGDMGLLHGRLLGKGLTYELGSWAEEIGPDGVSIVTLATGRSVLRAVDTVVLAGAREPADELYFELRDARPQVHRVGDCVAPRGLDHAIYEGFLAGRELWSTEQRHIPLGALETWDAGEGEEAMALVATAGPTLDG